MKKWIFSVVVILLTTYHSYAQDIPKIESKEEAIAILKNNNFMNILRNPTDTLANINLFIGEINNILPVDQETTILLRTKILPALQNNDRSSQYRALLFWPWSADYIRIGLNVDHVLKSNFNSTDYDKITEQLADKLTITNHAYLYLAKLRNKELTGEEIPLITPGSRESIENIYEYFGI